MFVWLQETIYIFGLFALLWGFDGFVYVYVYVYKRYLFIIV